MDYTGHVLVIIALLVWSAWIYDVFPQGRNKK